MKKLTYGLGAVMFFFFAYVGYVAYREGDIGATLAFWLFALMILAISILVVDEKERKTQIGPPNPIPKPQTRPK